MADDAARIEAPTTPTALIDGHDPAAVAIHFERSAVTYGALSDLGRRLAGGLAALGVGEGDRVGLWLPNAPTYLGFVLACCRLGAIGVAVNTRYRAVEVADIVGRSGCKVLAMQPGFKGIDFAGVLADIDPGDVAGLETVVLCDEDPSTAEETMLGKRAVHLGALEAAAPLAEDRSSPGTPVKIFTTSGTTKAPKFVLHSQGALARHGQDVARAFGYSQPDSVTLQVNPLCGVFGFSQAMGALASGRPMVMTPTYNAAESARLINELKVTHTCGSDEMFARLFEAGGDAERPFPTLQEGIYAGFNSALTDIVERADARGIRLMGVYGMSEVGALFSRWPSDAPMAIRRRGGGIPVAPEAQVRVRDRETGALLPEGEDGELEMKAPSMLMRYFGDEEATREAMTEDGFLRTGDLGHLEAGGGFVYQARMGDTMRLGGFLTSPAEIENRLHAQAEIAEAQVVGVILGGQPVAAAFLIPAPGAEIDTDAVCDRLRTELAGYKIPRRYYIVDAFPKAMSANGLKVQRAKLRQMAQENIDAEASQASG